MAHHSVPIECRLPDSPLNGELAVVEGLRVDTRQSVAQDLPAPRRTDWRRGWKPRVLCVFSHADDLEIACGGTVALLARQGCDLATIIVSDEVDENVALRRRNEATEGAVTLGIAPDCVWFLGLPDARVVCDGDSVARLRGLVRAKRFWPDIVFTHTRADHHNDHRAVARLVQSSLRNVAICAAYVVNSLDRSACQPELFIEIEQFKQVKHRALRCHRSQNALHRIRWQDMERLETEFAERLALSHVEAFEVHAGSSSPPARNFLASLNCSPFARLWTGLIGKRPLCVIGERSAKRGIIDYEPFAGSRASLDHLRTRLQNTLFCRNEVFERSSDDPSAEQLAERHDTMLVGGSITNAITSLRFNRYRHVRYVVEHEMPHYRSPHILDRRTGRRLRARFRSSSHGGRLLQQDFGLLTIMPNPEIRSFERSRALTLVGAMGMHGWGEAAACRFLTQDESIRQLLHAMPASGSSTVFQLLIQVDPWTGDVCPDWTSAHSTRYR